MANHPQMNGNIQRVLKAPTKPILDLATLQYRLPLYASDKEDGIRCIIHPTLGPVSQTMKPIPNHHIRNMLAHVHNFHLDGELVALDLKGRDCDFHDTQSAVMTQFGKPRFEFRVFDWFGNQYLPYEERMEEACNTVEAICEEHLSFLRQTLCTTLEELEGEEVFALNRGKEGIMLRHPQGWYKEGRSTLNEAYLLKVKRFMDDEAVVIGLEQEMENCNPATRDSGGLQKRSKHAVGMRPKRCVGKLLCMWRGLPIKIGSGLTHEQRYDWFIYPSQIVGKTVTFKYQVHGMKTLPRTPIFKGIRLDV